MRERLEIEQRTGGATEEVAITFGPHFRLVLTNRSGVVTFDLVATHHGVRFDASEVGGELERAIQRLRSEFPDHQID